MCGRAACARSAAATTTTTGFVETRRLGERLWRSAHIGVFWHLIPPACRGPDCTHLLTREQILPQGGVLGGSVVVLEGVGRDPSGSIIRN